MRKRLRPLLAWVSLVLIALLAAAPLWGPGIVNTRGGGDSPFLLQRAHQMTVNLRAGVLPVRWMPDGAYGLGYPFFHYYAALPYYLIGSLALLGIDLLTAIKAVQTLGFIAAGLAMYGWMIRLTRSRRAAWLAAVAYTFAPFHMVNVYVRGDSLSEFYAFLFYPLILWALDGLNDSPSLRSVVPPALAYGGLVLTHNISALIFSPFVLLYLLLGIRGRRSRLLGLFSLLLGLALSAWFWLPALTESGAVQLGTVTGGYFAYDQHFRTADLVQPTLLFEYDIAPGGPTPFAMGLAQAVLAGLGGLALLNRRRIGRGWWFVLLGLAVSTLMITPLSRPLWARLPLLPLVQFPWRFLSVQALFAAAITASNLQPPTSNLQPPLYLLAAAMLLAVSALFPLQPDRLPITSRDVTVDRLLLYELFTGNIGTTIRYEYLDRSVTPRPFTSDMLIAPDEPARAIPLDGADLTAVLVRRRPVRQVWWVSGEGGEIAFPLLYWPGWRSLVDGVETRVWPVQGSGYLALSVGPGDHTVILELGQTPVREVAGIVSLVTVGLLFLMAGSKRWRFFSLPLSLFLALLALVPLVTSFSPSPSLPDSGPTMAFAQMPDLPPNPGGVDFGVARLIGDSYSGRALAPGENLRVLIEWERGAGYTATLRLVSPAAVRYEVDPLAEERIALGEGLTTAATSMAGGYTLFSLSLPPDVPRGVYLIQLRLAGPEGEVYARTPAGHSMGTLYLQPVWVESSPPAPSAVLGPFGPDIRLHGLTLSQAITSRLSIRLDWSAVRPMGTNLGISLRLLDDGGDVVTSMDTQPGYGFLPTSLWRPGELVADRYLLPLPEGGITGTHHLELVLYQFPTLEPVGQARFGPFALPLEEPFRAERPPTLSSLPPVDHPLGVEFGQEIRLAGYDLTLEEEIRLRLWWQALKDPEDDYTVFVHLFDPDSEEIAAQRDRMPRDGAFPTSWWSAGEVVSDTISLPLEGLPAGTYRLAVGLYDRSGTRLRALDADGEPVPDDRLILPTTVILPTQYAIRNTQ